MNSKKTVLLCVLVLGGVALVSCQSSSPAPFNIPTVTPNTGPTSGGTVVTIVGEGFGGRPTNPFIPEYNRLFYPEVAARTGVTFGNRAATEVVVVNDNLLTCKAPPSDISGPANIVVFNTLSPGGTIMEIPDGFTYSDPPSPDPIPLTVVVSDLSGPGMVPKEGPANGGTVVTLRGTGFLPGTSVLFGGSAATHVNVVSGGLLTATTPAHAAGSVIVSLVAPDGRIAFGPDAFIYLQPPVQDPVPGKPRMVGAISTGNTSVLVSFSEPMGEGLGTPANYLIVQENVNPEVGTLAVLAANPTADRTGVVLTTSSQNEVTYRVTAVALKDSVGNTMAPPELLVDPTSRTFAGSPPGGAPMDSDGDGMTDAEELRGRIVTVAQGEQIVEQRQVTSDPFNADTDNDGLTDFEEFAIGSNGRSADTDTDGIDDFSEWNVYYSDPLNRDTDNDTLGDNLELFFKTSPLLDDTDGDQFNDNVELFETNRDPRISDLPKPRILVGNVSPRLDVRFTYTDTMGQSQSQERSEGSTMTQGTERTFSTSDEDSTKITVEASTELGVEVGFPKGGSVSGKFGLKAGFEQGHTSTVSQESKQSAEQAFERSLSLTATFDQSKSVTREVVGAALLLDVTIQNLSDTAFSIDNLELTAQQQDPLDRKRFLPVASLRPQNANLGPINLGPSGLVSERGPFVFNAVQIFPQQVEDLMKNPRGLIVKLANYDITDEFGRNFAFTSQEVFDKTAGITIDYGNGQVDSFRVAVNSTFDGNGRPVGITMAYALQDILGFLPDEADGYGTSVVQRDINGTPTPVQILTRVKEVESGFMDDPLTPAPGGNTIDRVYDERRTFWVIYSNGALDRNAINFDDVVLKARDQFAFVFVQDKDGDGVFATEESIHGSSDKNPNTDGCPDDDLSTPQYDGSCPARTFDMLTDYQEIKEGWTVQVEGKNSRKVYSDPTSFDSDADRLLDDEEKACKLDPRQRDTDEDGLSDYVELTGYSVQGAGGILITKVPVYSGRVILDGGNGVFESARLGDDDQLTYGPGDSTKGVVWISAGGDGNLDSQPGGDDIVGAQHDIIVGCLVNGATTEGFASDPLNADTDGGGIPDGAEVALRINPNNPFDDAQFRDTDRDGLPDAFEDQGYDATINGVVVHITTDKFDPDTDDDRLPDVLEYYLRSDARSTDTDGDGLPDFDEFDGPDTCITSAVPCGKFSAGWADFQTACSDPDATECNFDLTVLDTFGSRRLGTNLNRADTDGDGLSDAIEVNGYQITVDGQLVNVNPDEFNPNSDSDGWNDGQEYANTPRTNATLADTDGDGMIDNVEPTICASNGCRNPTVKDQRVTVGYNQLSISGDCDEISGDNCEDMGEFRYSLQIKSPSGSWATIFDTDTNISGVGSCDCGIGNSRDSCYGNTCPGRVLRIDGGATINLSGYERSYIATYGQTVAFGGYVREYDSCDTDTSATFGPNPCPSGCPFVGAPNASVEEGAATYTVPVPASQTVRFRRDADDVCGTLQDVNWAAQGYVQGQ